MPSARSQGEPLTGRFNIVSGENVEHIVMGNDDQQYLMASDAGYGFVGKFSDMVSKNKAGKAYLSLSTAAKIIGPQPVSDLKTDWCLAISNEGRMLMFPLRDLPSLGKGKGNKLLSIPSAKVQMDNGTSSQTPHRGPLDYALNQEVFLGEVTPT